MVKMNRIINEVNRHKIGLHNNINSINRTINQSQQLNYDYSTYNNSHINFTNKYVNQLNNKNMIYRIHGIRPAGCSSCGN